MPAQSQTPGSCTDITIPPGSCRSKLPDGDINAVLLIGCDCPLDSACRRSLSAVGIDAVVSTSSSRQALELVNTHRLFDAVVIGNVESNAKAMSLARRVAQYRPSTPTFLVSRLPNREELPGANPNGSSHGTLTFGQKIRQAITTHRRSRSR
jgi:hypothetical protein